MALSFVMIGDIVGKAGRRVTQQAIPIIKDTYHPDYIIANGENIAGGSGITPQLFEKLRAYGIHAVTLGDHALRKRDIFTTLNRSDRISRPANYPSKAPGKEMIRLAFSEKPPLYIITLQGRLFMNGPQADDPFAVGDRLIRQINDERANILIEIHCEATSEKVAVGHYFDGRVSAVVGTHTHVPTADAKLLPGGTAYITDLGMTGPYDSVLGRRKDRVLQFMSTNMPASFDCAEADPRLCGVYVCLDDEGRATKIERVEVKADTSRPPFV